MSCRVLRAYPTRVLTYEWRLGSKLLRTGQFDVQDSTEYTVSSLSRDSYGIYNCNIINEAGAGRCSFLVTGRLGGGLVRRGDGRSVPRRWVALLLLRLTSYQRNASFEVESWLKASGLDSGEVGNKIGDLAGFSGLKIKIFTCKM